MAVRMKFTDQPGHFVPAARAKVRDDGDMYERTLVWESDPDQQGITYDVIRDDGGKVYVYEVRPTQTTDCGCGGKGSRSRDASAIAAINDRNQQFWSKDAGTPSAPQPSRASGIAGMNARNRAFWGQS